LRFGTIGQPIGHSAQTIFPAYDVREAWMLTALHKCVLGFIERSLERDLSVSTVDIDTQDVHGRTPLWWACVRRDIEASLQLLRFGADPNIVDNDAYSPFLNAASRGCLELCLLLIRCGADVLHVSKYSHSALHLAYGFGSADANTFMQRILDANGHRLINSLDSFGWTPLARASRSNNLALARVLLANGADAEIPDIEGITPLLYSLQYNHNDITLLLLQYGASHLAQNYHGATVLHLAIYHGGVATLQILANFNLDGLDPKATNKYGYTAADLLNYRRNMPDGFIEASQRLLDELRCGNNSGDGQAIDVWAETSAEEDGSWVTTDEEGEEDEQDEFADALEEQ
jgi:uncharacterized protein